MSVCENEEKLTEFIASLVAVYITLLCTVIFSDHCVAACVHVVTEWYL